MTSGPPVPGRARRRRWRVWLRACRLRVRRTLPPGVRFLAGVVLILGGLAGFLPVLGFWMIPLGLAVAAADVVPVWQRLRGNRRR